MSKILSNKKIILASGVLFVYKIFMGSLVAFGLIRISIGLLQGDFNNVSFGMLD